MFHNWFKCHIWHTVLPLTFYYCLQSQLLLYRSVIRQQLTSTEDIRRTRKKAPCTRPEIWMIQKEFLEDEIFSEPIFTGEIMV